MTETANNDTQILNKLEEIMMSPTTGNGIAIVPYYTVGGKLAIVLLDVGEDDDTLLGRELGPSRGSLREAIVAAETPPPRAEEDDV